MKAAEAAADQIHSVSRTIAQEHGEKAAVILQYLAHHVSKSKHVHGGRKWFYKTLDDLAVVFPYLKRSTIHAILQRLGKENGPLAIGDYNKKGYDRTCWYAFADDTVRKQAQSSKPVYFRVEDAVNYGIVAAVLLGNLVHWIRENRKSDPQYTWHQILPGDLVEHLPFSKSTMQRGLRALVNAKVLKIKAVPGKGETAEYALVDETRLTDEEPGSGSKLDEGGSKLDMPGSKRDMGGSKLDNNTTLIDNLLKDDPLKDPSYVEPGVPSQPKHTLKTDKLNGVKDVHPFARMVASGTNTQKPMSSKGTGSAESLKLPKSPESAKSQESQKSARSPVSSSVSSGEGPVATSLPSAPTSESDRFTSGPKSKTRVKLSKSLEATFFKYTEALRTMKPVTAQSAVTLALDWITLFFRDTKPEELVEFLKILDQEALYDKLAELFAPHLAKHLERFTNTPERKLLAQFSSQLVMQFLTQGFCGSYDDQYVPVGSANSYRVSIMLRQKLRPYWDALEKRQQEKLKVEQSTILKKRAEQYASPDKAKETRADLSAAEKVQAFRNSLASRNNIGAFDDKGKLHHQVVDYNNRTFDAAYEFFKANPDFTVAALNVVLDKCLELPKERDYREEGTDSLWHARKAEDISFLIQHLDIIVKSLDCVDEIAPFQPVPTDQLFKKSKSTPKPETE
jgi:hypothetical protein